MSAATGYFRAGSSWLHRRNPITKLLGVALVLLSAFLLPPWFLIVLLVVLVLIAWSTGLGAPLARSLRIPALLFTSILVVNALFLPGATDRLLSLGPLAITREGLSFGLIAAGRILVAFLAMVLFLFTTLADDLLEALISRGASHRFAFVVLSAVQLVPRMQARAASILEAQQARGLPVTGSFRNRVRALVPLIGPVILGFCARPGRTAYRVVADPPQDRLLRWLLLAAIVAVVVIAVSGVAGS
jgi:energy-coupling factor transport system permease protein